jgi:hypothetical protein
MDRMRTPENARGDRPISTMSRKRYEEIHARVDALMSTPDANTDAVMQVIRDVMRYDPSMSRYCPENRERLVRNVQKWRKAKAKRDEAAQAAIPPGQDST